MLQKKNCTVSCSRRIGPRKCLSDDLKDGVRESMSRRVGEISQEKLSSRGRDGQIVRLLKTRTVPLVPLN